MTDLKSILKQICGLFTKVTYTNQKGETKNYTVRMGVRKYLVSNTGQREYKPTPEGAVKVYSITKGNTGYKTFYLEQIQTIKCGSLNFQRVW